MSGDDRDLLIEIKTMLQVALNRIQDGVTRADGHERRLQSVEQKVAVLEATAAAGADVAVLRAGEQRSREDQRARPNIWTIIGGVVGLVGLLVVIAQLTVNHS